ncbi:MAG: hypothetical protein WA708_03785 [Acidobacteriaceae bacterium]
MLRITLKESDLEQRWILQGRMTECSVGELVSTWRASRDRPSAQHSVVNLDDVTTIDRDGEEVLMMMIRDGAEFIAAGLYTKHLLQALKAGSTYRSSPA